MPFPDDDQYLRSRYPLDAIVAGETPVYYWDGDSIETVDISVTGCTVETTDPPEGTGYFYFDNTNDGNAPTSYIEPWGTVVDEWSPYDGGINFSALVKIPVEENGNALCLFADHEGVNKIHVTGGGAVAVTVPGVDEFLYYSYSLVEAGDYVWVLGWTYETPGLYAIKIDKATQRTVAAIDLASDHPGSAPDDIVHGSIVYDGTYLWATVFYQADPACPHGVKKIDPTSNTVVATVDTTYAPIKLVCTSGALWVSHPDDDKVTRINTATNVIVTTINVGNNPSGITSDGTYVWVVNEFVCSVSKIEIASNTVVSTIALSVSWIGDHPINALYYDGYVYVTDSAASANLYQIHKIDASTDAKVAVLYTYNTPQWFAVNDGYLWITANGWILKVRTANTYFHDTTFDTHVHGTGEYSDWTWDFSGDDISCWTDYHGTPALVSTIDCPGTIYGVGIYDGCVWAKMGWGGSEKDWYCQVDIDSFGTTPKFEYVVYDGDMGAKECLVIADQLWTISGYFAALNIDAIAVIDTTTGDFLQPIPLIAEYGGLETVESTTTLPSDGEWFLLTITMAPDGTVKFYKGCSQLGDSVNVTYPDYPGWDIDLIGASTKSAGAADHFHGWLDLVRVDAGRTWALSDVEALCALYNWDIVLTVPNCHSATQFDTVGLTQNHVLDVDDGISAGLYDSPAVQRCVVPSDGYSGGSYDVVNLTQVHNLTVPDCASAGGYYAAVWNLVVPDCASTNIADIISLEYQLINVLWDATVVNGPDTVSAIWNTVALIEDGLDTVAATFWTYDGFDALLVDAKDTISADFNVVARVMDAIDLISSTMQVSYVFDFSSTDGADTVAAEIQPVPIFSAEVRGLADRLAATLDTVPWFNLADSSAPDTVVATFLMGAAFAGTVTDTADLIAAILWVDPQFDCSVIDDVDTLIATMSAYNRFANNILRWPVTPPRFTAYVVEQAEDTIAADWDGGD